MRKKQDETWLTVQVPTRLYRAHRALCVTEGWHGRQPVVALMRLMLPEKSTKLSAELLSEVRTLIEATKSEKKR